MNARAHSVKSIGLTGGIASGKTAVSRLFAEAGADVIDTDLISRELVTPGSPTLQRIVQHFGPEICLASGELDRQQLRSIIFAEPGAREWLDNLLHPLIRQAVEDRLAASSAAYAVVVVPLLAEARSSQGNAYEFLDRVLLVDCPESLQIERLMQRDHCSREAAERMIQAQASREERLALADDIIENTGSLSSLQQQVLALHETYRKQLTA